MNFDQTFRTVWLWCLAFFVLAAFTGFAYRYGMLASIPFDLSLTNLRHAHSHLMFFNWVTPIPMLFIAGFIIKKAPEATGAFRKCIYTILLTGFASYPFFLFYGYGPVIIGSVQIPFSVILSGVVMIIWYWFVWIYMKYREKSDPGLARMFYDAALLMLVISSLGAWGVAVLQFSGVDNPLISAVLTHFFLAVFTEGWCMLSAFGILYHMLDTRESFIHESWLLAPIVLGVPLTFPFGISADLLNNQLLITASFGAFIIIVGLAANFLLILRKIRGIGRWWWFVVLNLLGAKIILLFGGALFPFMLWIGEYGLRVLYLHIVLLGFVSITYMAAWHSIYSHAGKTGFKLMTFAILLLLVMLIFNSGIVPPSWLTSWHFQALAIVSLFPVITGIWELITQWVYIPGPDESLTRNSHK